MDHGLTSMSNEFLDFEDYKDKALNKAIFTEEDINQCSNILMKMLKKIIFDEKITLNDFIIKHDTYMGSIGVSRRESNYRKNNILKAILRKDDITYNIFIYIVMKILKKNISSVSIVSVDKNGEKEYKINTTL